MFQRNNIPYGGDDDPFLTRPAGPGMAYDRRAGQDLRPQPPLSSQNYTRLQGGHDFGRYPDPTEPPRPAHVQGRYVPQYDDYDQGGYDQAGYDRGGYDQPRYEPHEGYTPAGYAPASHMNYDDYPPQGGARHDARIALRAASAPQPTAAQPDRRLTAPPLGARDYPPLPRGPDAYAAPEYDTEMPRSFGLPLAKLGQWAGALCTVALVLGAGYWGYALAVRDAHGIPVVRAAMGPLRIAPQTPGGEVSAHQGLAVNAIPAAGLGAEPPQEITLAPQNGTLSAADLAAAPSIAPPPNLPDDQADVPALSLTQLPEDMPLSDEEAVVRALEMALAEGNDFVEPPVEPVGMSTASPARLAVDVADIPEIDPAAIAPGTAMVQLGAFDDSAMARAEWANLQSRFAELMSGKALVVQEAQSGGRSFFRLRAHGFDGADDTRRFCAAILAENGTCLPVIQR